MSDDIQALQAACTHDSGIETFRYLDGKGAGLWRCIACSRKFVPLDLQMERDAMLYRQAQATAEQDPVRLG